MRTARSSSRLLGRGWSGSVHAGIHPWGVGIETHHHPQVWTWRPPQLDPSTPPGCGSGDLPPPVNRILDTRFWKYYLAPTSLRAVIKEENICLTSLTACKMRYPLNLVLESWEYLWFYWTFCIVILVYGLKLHKLSIHTLVILQKWLEIH